MTKAELETMLTAKAFHNERSEAADYHGQTWYIRTTNRGFLRFVIIDMEAEEFAIYRFTKNMLLDSSIKFSHLPQELLSRTINLLSE